MAYIARLTRTSMLEVLGQDYIRTARAKGLTEWKVVSQHAAKVAILPVVSFLGPLVANLLTGSIVIETIFNIPGAGGFFVNSILNNDGFLLEGVTIVYCVLLMGLNLLVDIAYPWLDRRIKSYEYPRRQVRLAAADNERRRNARFADRAGAHRAGGCFWADAPARRGPGVER